MAARSHAADRAIAVSNENNGLGGDSTPVPVRHLLLTAPGEETLTAHPAVHA